MTISMQLNEQFCLILSLKFTGKLWKSKKSFLSGHKWEGVNTKVTQNFRSLVINKLAAQYLYNIHTLTILFSTILGRVCDVGSQVYPQITPKSTPDLQRCITVRVVPYTHTQHIKVPKHFVYIQYGYGIQSEACCGLNNDNRTSFGLKSTPKTPKSTPNWHSPNSVRVVPYAHSHHIKVPKHFIYIQYGCWIQSEACCGLYHYITTLAHGLRSTKKSPKSSPNLHWHNSVREDTYACS